MRRPRSDDGRVLRHIRRANTHEVGCGSISVVVRGTPRANAAHDVVDELGVFAVACRVGIVLALGLEEPSV